jgi:hypothetical protein
MKKYNHPVEAKNIKHINKGQPSDINSVRYIKFQYENEKTSCGLDFIEEQCNDCIEYNKCKIKILEMK